MRPSPWLITCASFVLAACTSPAPASAPTASAGAASPRAAPSVTAVVEASPPALAAIVTRVDLSTLPPAEPTPDGLPAGRPTPTPAATVEPAWKYLSLTLAIENQSTAPRLVGISGSEPATTNLSGAILTTPSGSKIRALRSSTSFGLRTAMSRSLTSYPVLLRLPPGFRVTAESFGTLSTAAPMSTSLVFKVPAELTDYGTLTIPPLASLGPKADDEVAKRLRPLIGTLQTVQLGALQVGPQNVSFPTVAGPPAGVTLGVGTAVSVPTKVTATLQTAEVAAPTDYQARNRNLKQVILTVSYRNDDPTQARAFDVVAWLFGQDGVVYAGDAPTIGDFGRTSTPPEPSSLLLWDGRSAGADPLTPGQQEERKLTFLVPNALHAGTLVLAGDVEALFNVEGVPTT